MGSEISEKTGGARMKNETKTKEELKWTELVTGKLTDDFDVL
jgi:hypothetical protein